MLIIGLTGGTGAGKSTALLELAALGVRVVDCDRVYHGLLERSRDMLREIANRFPGAVEGSALRRKVLGELVFRDTKALDDLERITHKYVMEAVEKEIRAAEAEEASVMAVDAIALIESGLAARCDTVVGVVAPAEKRAARIVAREGITPEYAMIRIAGQKPEAFFRQNCDYVLENDGDDIEAFRRACHLLFSKMLRRYRDGKQERSPGL